MESTRENCKDQRKAWCHSQRSLLNFDYATLCLCQLSLVEGGMLGWDYYCACVTVDQVYSVYRGQYNCGNCINQPMVAVQIRPTIYASLNLFGKSTPAMVLGITLFCKSFLQILEINTVLPMII
jgi:hypothetical protein